MLASALLSRRAVAGAMIVLAVSTAAGRPASAGAATPKPCARAAALEQAGFLKEAQAAYKAALGKAPCAIDGVKRVTATLARQASPKRRAPASFAAAVTLIRRLEAEGFESEARKKAQELIESYPERAIPNDIRAIDQPVGWWRGEEGRLGPAALMVAELAIVVLGTLVVVLVAFKALFALCGRFRRRYTVAKVIGPVTADAAGQGEVLAAELARIAGKGGTPVRRVEATEGNFTLPPALTNAYPQAGIIAALLSVLDRVLPRRLLTISAAVLPVDPVRGVGVTTTITRRGGREPAGGSRTIRESEFGPVDADGKVAERIARLMLPAAVWLGYRPEIAGANAVQRAVQRVRGDRAEPRLPVLTGRTSVLGTTDWRSYAHFALAELAQKAGETVTARSGYFKALDASPANLGARLNLAGLLLYRPGGTASETDTDHDWRLAFCQWLLDDAATTELMRGADRRLRWRWLYLRAARALAAKDFPAATDDTGPAPQERYPIDELCESISSLKRPTALADEMRWPAFVLRRSILLEQRTAGAAGQAPAVPDVEALDPSADTKFMDSWWTSNTLYNLACYYARAARCHAAGADRDHLRDKAHDALYDAIDRAAEPQLMLAMAQCDPVLDDVLKTMTVAEMDALKRVVPPSYDADQESGHALGVRIGEAIRVARAGGTTATARKP